METKTEGGKIISFLQFVKCLEFKVFDMEEITDSRLVQVNEHTNQPKLKPKLILCAWENNF